MLALQDGGLSVGEEVILQMVHSLLGLKVRPGVVHRVSVNVVLIFVDEGDLRILALLH